MKFDPNTANDGASAKASPFHALIVLGKNDCPYILAILFYLSSLPSLLRKRRPPQGCNTTRRPQGWWCSFYYLAPVAWNNLPDSVVESDTINTLKKRLDNHWKDHALRYDFLATTPNMHPE